MQCLTVHKQTVTILLSAIPINIYSTQMKDKHIKKIGNITRCRHNGALKVKSH